MAKHKNLFASLESAPLARSLRQRVEKGGVLSFPGVSAGAQPLVAALLRRLFPERPIVLVTEGVKSQESFHQDMQTWFQVAAHDSTTTPDGRRSAEAAARLAVHFYPGWEVLPHEDKLPHVDVISERLETLMALAEKPGASLENSAATIVTNVLALLQRTFAPATLRGRMRRLTRGERIDPLDLVEWLEEAGYEPEAQVNQKGEIALRGGILDVFPLSSPWPVRLEFFGDELESLRYFDPISQISKETIETISLPPAGELGLLKSSHGKGVEDGSSSKRAGKAAEDQPLATLLDYLSPTSIFLLCEPENLAQIADDYSQQVPEEDPFFIGWEDLRQKMIGRGMTVLELSELGFTGPTSPSEEQVGRVAGRVAGRAPDQSDHSSERRARSDAPYPADVGAEFEFQSLQAFRPLGPQMPEPQIAEAQRRDFFGQVHRWLRQGWSVHVFCNNQGERQRFEEIWSEYGFAGEPKLLPRLHLGALTRGFLCEAAKFVVVTDAEIFGRYKVQRPRRLKSPHAQTSRSLLDIDFTELEEGDYVVHLQHGIGRYLGLKLLPASAGEKPLEKSHAAGDGLQECLVIEYAPSDPAQPPPKLYVPVHEAHLVSKYVGAGKARPPLNTLGGGRWAKAKEQAQEAVRDLAGELLSIQAARESQEGHSFPGDAPWQREFESAFLFEETPDQMRAIVQTKADMESPKPMDRLICGDVGYGKTEVAIRAAFKAVMGGRQVAVLVPTTILAQQHFNTFRERMADYPVRIELLSRFRTAREQKTVLTQLAAGAVDIIIGTHRLVQNDVAFKDLGLVVIDEEQRFGVLQKEKFKQFRQLVDVLTLSATPIPRTLYLALTGARDLSTIETPPQDRLPVETIVTQYDERIIRDAIQRELNRGGQVFYLHNRVFDISAVAERLRALLPKARIVVGHGQMDSDELEDVMTRFVSGQADVLLSTTIIESGLDIPNANTIIIDRADRFGLSDLYQLRGRVGRYKHQAYAYLLVPRHATLLTDARKRISAIKQYSTLGSGFKIAMRDLEIRGAGNLLGPQQSGHITAVGFDLYCQLLKQSISALKGEKVKPRVEARVRLDFLDESAESPSRAPDEAEGSAKPAAAHASIPINYIADARQRVELYRKLAQITDGSGTEKLRGELRDRFGPLPASVELLLDLANLKVLASERGISLIETNGEKLMLTRNNDYVMIDGKFPRLMRSEPKARLKEIKGWLRKL